MFRLDFEPQCLGLEQQCHALGLDSQCLDLGLELHCLGRGLATIMSYLITVMISVGYL